MYTPHGKKCPTLNIKQIYIHLISPALHIKEILVLHTHAYC